jgi:hypothetical protein
MARVEPILLKILKPGSEAFQSRARRRKGAGWQDAGGKPCHT